MSARLAWCAGATCGLIVGAALADLLRPIVWPLITHRRTQ